MRRWVLSKKDKKQLVKRLTELYPRFDASSIGNVEIAVEDDIKLYIVDSIPAFIDLDGMLIPHLKLLLRHGYREWLPYIVVDQGAVRPISRGADLMRPGIQEIPTEFKENSIVVIAEPSRQLPLAVHQSFYSSQEIAIMEKGRVTKKLHNLGDRFWKFAETL